MGVLLALTIRALAPLVPTLVLPLMTGSARAGSPPELWVADRDGDCVMGLDANLHFATRRTLRRPVALCLGEASIWVLCAEGVRATGLHALYRLGPSGEPQVRVALEVGEAQIASVRRGAVLCLQDLEGSEWCVLTLLEADGEAVELLRVEAAMPRLSSNGDGRALFSSTGHGLALIDLPHAGLGPVDLEIIELGESPEGFKATHLADSCWFGDELITLEEDGVLRRIGLDGAEKWSTRSAECWGRGDHAPRLLVAHGSLWLFSRRRAWIERRDLKTGERVGRGLSALPHGIVDSGTEWREGGVLFAAGGALLHLDRRGRVAPGQGGFRFVSDLLRSKPALTPQGGTNSPRLESSHRR